jgi:hypothetical protein
LLLAAAQLGAVSAGRVGPGPAADTLFTAIISAVTSASRLPQDWRSQPQAPTLTTPACVGTVGNG